MTALHASTATNALLAPIFSIASIVSIVSIVTRLDRLGCTDRFAVPTHRRFECIEFLSRSDRLTRTRRIARVDRIVASIALISSNASIASCASLTEPVVRLVVWMANRYDRHYRNDRIIGLSVSFASRAQPLVRIDRSSHRSRR